MNFDPLPWLQLLAHQTLALSLGLLVILAVRGRLIRRFGAAVAYVAWVVLPLLLVAASLPASEPARALRTQVLTRIEPLVGTAASLPELVQPTWPWVLTGVWMAGAVLCALRLVWLQRQFINGLHLHDGQWQGPEGSGPALVGLLNPRLVLPPDFEHRFDADQRKLVLAHEGVHRARADNHWNALAAALCLLHWFNPLAWLALRRMRVDQELACDAAVMAQHPGSHAAYARALLLAQSPLVPAASLPWASWQTTHPLVERIEMLKNSPISTRRRVVGYALLAGLAVTGVGVAQVVGAQDTAGNTAAAADVEMKLNIDWREEKAGTVNSMRTETIVRLKWGKHSFVDFPIHGTSPQKDGKDRPALDGLSVELLVDDLGDGAVMIATEVKKGEPRKTIAHPRLKTMMGQNAQIEVGNGGPNEKEILKLSLTPNLVARPKS